MKSWLLLGAGLLTACTGSLHTVPVPAVSAAATGVYDHHVHAFSPAASAHLEEQLKLPKPLPTLTASELDVVLRADGVARAALLSEAYFFSRPGANTPEMTRKMRAENDWTAAEAARYPDRLAPFCSFNPLADHALGEIDRCVKAGHFAGFKLHLANSKVDLRDPEHVLALKRVFRRLNTARLPVVIHMRTERPDYGREDAEIFIRELLPVLRDTALQIAHAAGWGGYDPATDAALMAFADALDGKQLRHAQLYFDLSAVVRGVSKTAPRADAEWWPDRRYARLFGHMRRIGLDRFLFATDWPEWTPSKYRDDLASQIPFAPGELERILGNRAPWLAHTR